MRFLSGMFIENEPNLSFCHEVNLHSNYLRFCPSMLPLYFLLTSPSYLFYRFPGSQDTQKHSNSLFGFFFFSLYCCCLCFVVYKGTEMSLFISLSALGNVSIQAIKLLRVWFCRMFSKSCWGISLFLHGLEWVCRTFIPPGRDEDQVLIGVKFRRTATSV